MLTRLPGRVAPSSPRVVLAAAATAQAAVSFLTFGLPSIGPQIREQYGLSLTAVGAVLTANLFGSGLALLAAGVAVDRYGSRATMYGGTLLGVLGLLLAATADSGLLLGLGLLLSGIGVAVVPVAGAGALFRAYAPERRGWALGVRQMAVPLGGTIAAATLPGLEALGGVHLTIIVGMVVLGLAGIAFAVLAGDDTPTVRPGLALGRVWRAPGMKRLLLVAAFYIVVLQALLTYTVASSRAAGLSAFAAGAAFFALNVAAVVARLVWGRIADRGAGSRRVRTLVDIGFVSAAGALLFTLALHVGAGLVLPAVILFGFGAFGWNAIVYLSAGERMPPELAGQSVAFALTVVFVLSALCTPPLGAIAEHVGWDAFWLTTAALAAAGAFTAARIPRHPVVE
jgi:MFS family permease